MTFLWPSMLFLLLLAPLLTLLYLRLQRRRPSARAAFSLPAATPAASGPVPGARRTPGFRRHVPALLFLLSLVVLLVALARPHAQLRLPRIEGTVVLVFDVSASMSAADVEPSRLEAAKAAAREFVLSQPPTVKIAIVSFAGSGFTVQTPTNDTNSLLATIDRLKPGSGTSLGQGILTALNTIAVDAGLTSGVEAETPTPMPTPAGGQGGPGGPPLDALLAQLPAGPYPASTIVILSDGENTESVDPLEAAVAAAERDVRIDTLGFGATAGTVIEVDGFSVHTALDEGSLASIADAARGTYHPTAGQEDLKEVYASLTPELVVKPEAMEVTSVFAGAGIALLLLGSLLSILWFNRLL
jgi:Ca-activated chloride channel family protein